MSENTNLPAVQQPSALAGLASTGRVNLDRVHAQMQAMQNNNFGGSSGGSYDISGKVKVEVNKNGTLTYMNPFTGKPDGGKILSVAIIDVKFQLQRWLGEGEVIEGIDSENQKGPLCRSVQFTDPVDKSKIDESGWFYAPAMSAYHARKMLPDLTGSNGANGQCGLTMCSECPLAQQGLKGPDAKCKPAGMMEIVIFGVGTDMYNDHPPIYAYVKLSVTSIIAFSEYLDQIKKRYDIGLAQAVCTQLECIKVTDKGKTYGKLQFHVAGAMTPEIVDASNAAIAATEEILKAAEEAEKEGAGAATGGGPKAKF